MQAYATELFPPTAASSIPEVNLSDLSLAELRDAIRNNLVSFPAQMPSFTKGAPEDIQWRVALLYFIHGWNTKEIGKRYGLTSRERVRQILRGWKRRAIQIGYIQPIPRMQSNGAEPEFTALPYAYLLRRMMRQQLAS